MLQVARAYAAEWKTLKSHINFTNDEMFCSGEA